MDNFTIVAALNIVLGINIIFTFIISRNAADYGLKEWRYSSILLFAGFFLLMMQKHISLFASVCLANYLIIIGLYYQTAAAVHFETLSRKSEIAKIIVMSVLFWGLFLFFTYYTFNTHIRIIIMSAFLVYVYVSGAAEIHNHKKISEENTIFTIELYYLFIFSAVFYTFRTVLTLLGLSSVSSIFDRDIYTTISLLYPVIYVFIYFLGMSNGSLRQKNSVIIKEKEKFSCLFDFLNDTAKHLEINELYKSIEDVLKKSLGVRTAVIYLIDEGGETLSISYSLDEIDLPLDDVKTIKIGEGAAGRAVAEDRIVEIEMDKYPIRSIAEQSMAKGVSHFVSVPLKTAEGIIGAITAVYSAKRKNIVLDKDFFTYLGDQIGLVLNNAFLYKKIREFADTDPLTGLLNRRKMLEFFEHEMKRVKRSGRVFSVAMADIDYFKKINDKYGHNCGDEVLKQAASVFRKICRETDHICRWGGEEFLILFIDADLSSAASVSERIRKAFENRKLSCIESEIITISIGVAEYKAALSAEKIIKRADNALYSAKINGRNRVETA